MTLLAKIDNIKTDTLLIDIPSEYKGKDVEIIINLITSKEKKQKINLKGSLSEFANLEKIKFEKNIWKNSVKDNIDC